MSIQILSHTGSQECPTCKEPFTPYMIGQVYCGATCRRKAGRERAKARDPKRQVPNVAKAGEQFLALLLMPSAEELRKLKATYERADAEGHPFELRTLLIGAMPREMQEEFAAFVNEEAPQRWSFMVWPKQGKVADPSQIILR
jgi:hypothetical protein